MGLLNFPYQTLTEADLTFLVAKYKELQKAFDDMRESLGPTIERIEEFEERFKDLDTIVEAKVESGIEQFKESQDLVDLVQAESKNYVDEVLDDVTDEVDSLSYQVSILQNTVDGMSGSLSGDFGTLPVRTTSTMTAGISMTAPSFIGNATSATTADHAASSDLSARSNTLDITTGTSTETAVALFASGPGVGQEVETLPTLTNDADGLKYNGKKLGVDVDTVGNEIFGTSTAISGRGFQPFEISLGDYKLKVGYRPTNPSKTGNDHGSQITFADCGIEDFEETCLFVDIKILGELYKTQTATATSPTTTGFRLTYTTTSDANNGCVFRVIAIGK